MDSDSVCLNLATFSFFWVSIAYIEICLRRKAPNDISLNFELLPQLIYILQWLKCHFSRNMTNFHLRVAYENEGIMTSGTLNYPHLPKSSDKSIIERNFIVLYII
jgi:hypothetical protein